MSIDALSKPALIAATTAAVAVGVGGYIWHENRRPQVLEIYVFALKSGNSLFIRTPDDRRILVDGGANAEVVRHLTDILPFYSRRIDAVISTDTESTNVTGLIDVVDRYEVNTAYIPAFTPENVGIASTSPVFQTYIETLKEKRVSIQELSAGDHLVLGGESHTSISPYRSVTADVIFPVSPDRFKYSSASSPHAIIRIVYGDTSVLLLGNASKKVQKFIASSESIGSIGTSTEHADISNTDLVIMYHSGSPDSVSRELADLVEPQFLIYEKSSVSTKTKKKPVPDSFATILPDHRFNLKEKGTVTITSDGKTISISQEGKK